MQTYELGIAFGGGGAKGYYQAGVFKRLLEMGCRPGIVSGTSVGSLVAALYADGHTPDEMMEAFADLTVKDFLEARIPKDYIVSPLPVRKILEKTLRARTFEELQIPLKVVATCLETGEGVVFDKGPLIEALMASCSVPVVFPPVLINGKHYVDGGVVKNLPVSHIRNDCKKGVAIGLHPEKEKKYSRNMRYIAERCLWFMFNANSYMDKDLADVLIEDHEMAEYTAYDLKYKNEMFRLGYDSPSRDNWCPFFLDSDK